MVTIRELLNLPEKGASDTNERAKDSGDFVENLTALLSAPETQVHGHRGCHDTRAASRQEHERVSPMSVLEETREAIASGGIVKLCLADRVRGCHDTRPDSVRERTLSTWGDTTPQPEPGSLEIKGLCLLRNRTRERSTDLRSTICDSPIVNRQSSIVNRQSSSSPVSFEITRLIAVGTGPDQMGLSDTLVKTRLIQEVLSDLQGCRGVISAVVNQDDRSGIEALQCCGFSLLDSLVTLSLQVDRGLRGVMGIMTPTPIVDCIGRCAAVPVILKLEHATTEGVSETQAGSDMGHGTVDAGLWNWETLLRPLGCTLMTKDECRAVTDNECDSVSVIALSPEGVSVGSVSASVAPGSSSVIRRAKVRDRLNSGTRVATMTEFSCLEEAELEGVMTPCRAGRPGAPAEGAMIPMLKAVCEWCQLRAANELIVEVLETESRKITDFVRMGFRVKSRSRRYQRRLC